VRRARKTRGVLLQTRGAEEEDDRVAFTSETRDSFSGRGADARGSRAPELSVFGGMSGV